jgi:hypothetical protein
MFWKVLADVKPSCRIFELEIWDLVPFKHLFWNEKLCVEILESFQRVGPEYGVMEFT